MTERETVIKKLQEALDDAENNGNIYTQIRRPVVFETIVLLKEQPEIVRCKDCKHWMANTQFCGLLTVDGFTAHRTPSEWFCADGERRDDDD